MSKLNLSNVSKYYLLEQFFTFNLPFQQIKIKKNENHIGGQKKYCVFYITNEIQKSNL